MARLPTPGGDINSWGSILNDYLSVEHAADGSLKLRSEGVVMTSLVGQANGIAPLDSSSLLPASVLRNFNDRGVAKANTAYNKWDTVVYNGRRILMTAAYTSNSSGFISAANYTQIGGQHIFYAYDFGYRADGSQSSAANNTSALQSAVNAAAAVNGGTIVLPFGYGFINSPVELKNRVWLQGSSTYGTVLQLADNANCHMVINHVSTNGTSDPNAMWCGLVNLTLDGRKSSQTGAGPYYGVYFNTNPFNTAASSDLAFDPTYLLSNIHVRNAHDDGIHINGRSDARIGYCKVSFCNGNGYRSSFDTHLDHCISEGAGLAGFLIQNSSVQVVGCKSYTSGQVTANSGHGFVVQGTGIGEVAFVGCDAQQVKGYGFSIEAAGSVAINGCNVSQCSFGNGTSFCAYNLDGASYCTISGTSQNTIAANALRLVNGSSKNMITITHAGSGVGSVLAAGSLVGDNIVYANGQLISSLNIQGSSGVDIFSAKTTSGGSGFSVDQFGNATATQKFSVGGTNAPHTFNINSSLGFPTAALISTNTTLGSTNAVVMVNQAVTITLPSTSGVVGRLYSINNISAGTVTVAAAAGQTVLGSASASLPAGGSLLLFSYGTSWYRFGSTI